MNIKDKLKTQIEGHLNDELVWLESSKQGLIDETKNISENFDWTKFEFHLYHIHKAIGKLEILKRLLKSIEKDD